MPAQRILVVEDEPILAAALQEVLTSEGYIVIGPVGRLASAMALAQSAEIDLALLDVNLHGELVYPVALILTLRRVPYALMTGYGHDDLPVEYQNWISLTKPFPNRQLLHVLHQLNVAAGSP
jgi:DNA-binding response OmpR family regulator